ncbi:hypothetical protein ABW19_dt0205075 [Dactylella cylindrospora]|nr:hypothetical protein ABW19_dt0205075 [Dactylella cylindrospora]
MGQATSANKITAQDRAILDMKVQRDKLKAYQKRIQIVLDREHEIAKECLRNGQKDKALLALRKRKYQEQLLKKTDGHLETLEQLTSTIEFSLIQQSIVHGLQEGNKVLKEIQKEMSLERVELIVGETQDAIAYQKQVSEMLGTSMSNEDEDAVEDEYEALLKEAKAEERRKQGLPEEEVPALPNAPNGELVTGPVAEEEDEEVKTKQRWRERKEQLLAA